MRKGIIITCLILSGLIILDSVNFGHSLAMLVVAGVVPGTSFIISADAMMAFFALLIGFTLSRLTRSIFQRQMVRSQA